MEIKEPNINNNLKNSSILEEYTKDKEFKNISFTGYYPYIEIGNSSFTSCNFNKANFQGLDITNTIIKLSDLSNQQLTEHSYQQIIFDNCNLIGINFTDSYLENITFKNCNLSYSNFSNTNLKNIIFDNCNLKESTFSMVKWKSLNFENSDLTEVEFFQTSLQNLDLSTCLLQNIKVDITKLKGLQVNYEQALSLSLLLGIKIKD